MKNICLLILSLTPHLLTAQSFLIPFSQGTRQGLINNKKIIVVPPQYDRISWITGHYFKTTATIPLNDTIETSPHNYYIQNDEITLSGLYYGEKQLLKNEPFSSYEILQEKCIIARSDGTRHRFTKEHFLKYGRLPKFFSLFNLNGENVHPKNFRSLQYIDTTGTHPSLKGFSRYVLFAAEDFENEKGIFVYDASTQKIKEWLVQGLHKPKLISSDEKNHSFSFSDSDDSEYETNYRIFSDGENFRVERKLNQRPLRSENNFDDRVGTITMEGDDHVAVPDIPHEGLKEPHMNDAELRKRFHPFYTSINDSLFYVVFVNEKIFIPVPESHTPIFLRPTLRPVQTMPVIVKSGKKFFLADSAGIQKTAYDSMMYFGSNFLVWKNSKGKLSCGTIDKKGKMIIPIAYDSIVPGMHTLNTISAINSNSTLLHFTSYQQPQQKRFENGSHTISISQTLLAFKKGSATLLSPTNESLLPLKVNLVAENSIHFFRPAKTDFMVIEKNKKYGVIKKEGKRLIVEIYPTLPFIPVFYYYNYYGIPGLKVYALYNRRFEFQGFGLPNGKMLIDAL